MDNLFLPFSPYTVNEGYGYSEWRKSPTNPTGLHDGIDLAAAQGTPLYATTSGRVIIYSSVSGGNGVDIVRPDGNIVRAWHLSRFDVTNGQHVNAGDLIGLSGGAKGTPGAGNSTGAHLHWGTKVNGKWVDPFTLDPVPFGSGQNTKSQEENMKVIRSEGGRVALVGEFIVSEYTNDEQKSWNGGVNTKAFGEAKNLSNDEFQALIDQATERRLSLIREIKA